MRTLLGVLVLAVAVAALPEGREAAEAKQKIQAMLDEAALLEQAGRRDEAARVRAEAEAMKKRLEGKREGGDDPRVQALKSMEKAIAALDQAGYEGMAKEMRGMAETLRGQIKGGDRGPENPDVDFWRRNLDTLRIARNGLLEAQRKDGADLLGRAIHARELLIEGKHDRAGQAMKEGPGELDIAELLHTSAGFWRSFGQAEKAVRCEELGNFLQHRVRERGGDREMAQRAERRERAGPDDRMAQLEERVARMERMLHDALERLEARDRESRSR